MGTLLAERRLSLHDLARSEGVNPATVRRWCLLGCRGAKLESFTIGLRRFTTHEAFVRFVQASTASAAGGGPPKEV